MNKQKHDTNDTETKQPASAGCITPTCSRSFSDLLESLDAWIEDALKNSKPIGLTLSRARVTITDQHNRIGEILDALECQNEKVKTLREQMKNNPWCEACKEPDCCVSGDGTCAMIRKYLSSENANVEASAHE